MTFQTTESPDQNLSEFDINEQGRITPVQRSRLLRTIFWQVLLCFAIAGVFSTILFHATANSLGGSTDALLVTLVATLVILALNVTQLIDLTRGKVSVTRGNKTTRSTGSGRNRSVATLIGETQITTDLVTTISGLMGRAFKSGVRYTAYYLPISHVVVSSYSAEEYFPGQEGGLQRVSERQGQITQKAEFILAGLSLGLMVVFLAVTSAVR